MNAGQSSISGAGSDYNESMMTGFSLNSSIDAGMKQPQDSSFFSNLGMLKS